MIHGDDSRSVSRVQHAHRTKLVRESEQIDERLTSPLSRVGDQKTTIDQQTGLRYPTFDKTDFSERKRVPGKPTPDAKRFKVNRISEEDQETRDAINQAMHNALINGETLNEDSDLHQEIRQTLSLVNRVYNR